MRAGNAIAALLDFKNDPEIEELESIVNPLSLTGESVKNLIVTLRAKAVMP